MTAAFRLELHRIRRGIRIAAAVTAAASASLALACASSTGVDGGHPRPARTALPRTLTAAEQASANSANAFSFALWNELNKSHSDTNLFVSPLSASFALGMAVNGANGATLDEMRAALQAGGRSVDDMNAGYKGLVDLLVGLDPSVTMQIANSIWYRNTFTFNQSFVDADRTWFDATVTPLDFNNSAASLSAINGWVTDKTHGKIDKILDQINPEDQAFLINAIYFKGSWREKFDPSLTRADVFHGSGGDKSADFMHRTAMMSYTATAAYQAVDLPYGDSAFTMTVILPSGAATVDQIAASLPTVWPTLSTAFTSADIGLALPKFTVEWDHELKPELQTLGMRLAFTDFADFSKMTPRAVEVSKVRQKTYVSVDEEGTEAAAVTSVGIVATSAPAIIPMTVDHPFIFVIRERLSGTILFMGRVTNLPQHN